MAFQITCCDSYTYSLSNTTMGRGQRERDGKWNETRWRSQQVRLLNRKYLMPEAICDLCQKQQSCQPQVRLKIQWWCWSVHLSPSVWKKPFVVLLNHSALYWPAVTLKDHRSRRLFNMVQLRHSEHIDTAVIDQFASPSGWSRHWGDKIASKLNSPCKTSMLVWCLFTF